jgi:group I intron endonuclease
MIVMINIYAYQNKIDGKIYIGQTRVSLAKRCRQGKGYRQCPRFHNAIAKYGLTAFDRWIFQIVSSQEEANHEEEFWIDEMRKQIGKDNVYNLSSGGSNHSWSEESKEKMRNHKRTQEHKDNISKARTGISNPNFSHPHTDEHKLRQSIRMTGKGNPNFGKSMSKEQKEKISKAMTRKS